MICHLNINVDIVSIVETCSLYIHITVDGSNHLAQASKQYQPQLSQATYLAQTTNSSGQALLPAGAGQLVGGVSPIQLPIRLPSQAIPVTNVQHPFRPQVIIFIFFNWDLSRNVYNLYSIF